MKSIKGILIFTSKVLLIYLLLVLAGPAIGLHSLNTKLYGGLCETFLDEIADKGVIQYKEIKGNVGISDQDYQMTLIHKDLLEKVKREARINAAGQGAGTVKTKVKAKNAFINFWQYGFLPTALFLALMLATPLPLRRKLLGLGIGFLLVQVFIFVRIYFTLLNHFQSLDWLAVYDWSPAANERLSYIVDKMLYFGSSLIVVVFIWLIASSGKDEFKQISRKLGLDS